MAKKKQTVPEQSPVQKHIARIDKLYGVVMKQSVHGRGRYDTKF